MPSRLSTRVPSLFSAIVVYFVGSALALALLVIANWMTHGELKNLRDLNERLRDKWAQTETLCRKLDVIALWFLDRKNMTLENTGSWGTPWLVVAKKDPNDTARLSEIWAEVYAHREEIAHELYEANLAAMRKFADEQHKEKSRKEIYEEKKALRGAKK